MRYEVFFKNHLRSIEKALHDLLRRQETRPLKIHKAMQYSAFSGGKRFRPVLTLTTCEACGGNLKDALPAACAVELIHTYSLVHDDLPALDNDAMRRGKPTCHKQFDEATAVLVGDGLLTLAFEVLARVKPASKAVALVKELSTAAGVHGMIGGQVEDIATASKKVDFATHDFICVNKTGKLICASALAGAIVAGASLKKIGSVTRYSECLGLAFQVIDDILDGDGYCRIMPQEQVVAKATILIDIAKQEAIKVGPKANGLIYLADFLKSRIPQRTTHAQLIQHPVPKKAQRQTV